MIMTWFLPMGLAIGAAGTRTVAGHSATRAQERETAWWLLTLAWLPCFCWLLAQVIGQY